MTLNSSGRFTPAATIARMAKPNSIELPDWPSARLWPLKKMTVQWAAKQTSSLRALIA
jgi:hypothetical protein